MTTLKATVDWNQCPDSQPVSSKAVSKPTVTIQKHTAPWNAASPRKIQNLINVKCSCFYPISYVSGYSKLSYTNISCSRA